MCSSDLFPSHDIYVSTKDLVIKEAKHKRFTMKDIAKIENRVDAIEEVTLLNSLERDVQNVDFKDRFKSGFIADNFASQNGADTDSSLHRCAYDLRDAEVRPRNMQNPIDLNRVTSSGMTYHADGVGTLAYTQKPMISQNLGSTIIRIQPYILYDWIGSMTLLVLIIQTPLLAWNILQITKLKHSLFLT